MRAARRLHDPPPSIPGRDQRPNPGAALLLDSLPHHAQVRRHPPGGLVPAAVPRMLTVHEGQRFTPDVIKQLPPPVRQRVTLKLVKHVDIHETKELPAVTLSSTAPPHAAHPTPRAASQEGPPPSIAVNRDGGVLLVLAGPVCAGPCRDCSPT